MNDLKIYHKLMNAIFPDNSIYCPVLSWEERVYNVVDHDPIFDPDYSYFLEDKGNTIGFIVAYPHQQNLIVKTIGLLPDYRNKNLSGILIKRVHDQAEKDGLKAAIYSTIRVGNAVYKMKRPGVKVYRKYVTMRKHL
jgi:GNAT superfamily N-acetyltransferase